ncbi:MAG: SAM-dependent methyltransferase [Ruminococcus flavefaciens]|nr:SAM-dependent methyltransferase [Ruminococcus flavefaciens]
MDSSFNKLRGGYYTPKEITRFIAEWAIRNSDDKVLEPSCGDGHFLEAARNTYVAKGAKESDIYKNLLGVELYSNEAQKARNTGAKVIDGDFFSYYKENIKGKEIFRAVIGNPPFIRYQNFDEAYRKCAFELVS